MKEININKQLKNINNNERPSIPIEYTKLKRLVSTLNSIIYI